MIYKIIKLTQCYLKLYWSLGYAIILTRYFSDEVPEFYFMKQWKKNKVFSKEGTCKSEGNSEKKTEAWTL